MTSHPLHITYIIHHALHNISLKVRGSTTPRRGTTGVLTRPRSTTSGKQGRKSRRGGRCRRRRGRIQNFSPRCQCWTITQTSIGMVSDNSSPPPPPCLPPTPFFLGQLESTTRERNEGAPPRCTLSIEARYCLRCADVRFILDGVIQIAFFLPRPCSRLLREKGGVLHRASEG